MLNPTEPEGSGSSSSRIISGATSESPSSAVGPAPQFGTSPSTATPHTFPGQPPPSESPTTAEGYGGSIPRVRKILTPRSPSQTVSAGRGIGRGTIDAQRSPFLPSRGRPYTTEPSASSEIPPMPTPPGHPQQQYGFPPAISTPSSVDRRASGVTMQAPGQPPLSQTTSPSISVSSQNPSSSQTSPAASFPFHKGGQAPPPAATPYYPGSSFGTSMQQGGGMQHFGGASAAPEGPYSAQAPQTQGGGSLYSSSAGSSRQTSASDPIQVLTITTSQGSYTVPVDVHQASRLADEKRARNAGASARFRQRRKEKEKEASVNIEKLNQQNREMERKLRDMEQERDFYRAERDRFRDVIFRAPEMRHLAMQAPPSPHTIRAGSFQGPMSQMGGPPSQMVGFQAQENTQERAPRRRRTDTRGDFASVPYSLPQASTLAPVQAAGYAPGSGPPPHSLPPLRIDNTAAPQTTSSNVPPTTSTAPPPQPPYGPYSRSPYERSWSGESGRR
jgi:hypothetical protein